MADIVNESPTPLTRPEPVPIVSRRRFGAAYLLLAVIVGAAVGLIVVLAGRDTTHRQVADTWSTWKPATAGTEGVREIARHVSPSYQLANGHQLLGVVAGPMQIPSTSRPVPVSALLISSGIAGRTQERVDITFPNAGVFYQLCGSRSRVPDRGHRHRPARSAPPPRGAGARPVHLPLPARGG